MKRYRRRSGARYYPGPKTDSPPATDRAEARLWTLSRQETSSFSKWERFWLILVVISGLLTVLLPFWPGAEWPRLALISGAAALLGIVSILAFFLAYLRARTP